MLAWTVAIAGWFALIVVDGSVRPVSLVAAVGGLFAVIWLLGLMILAFFLVRGD